jgi:RND family efflux transporter MFP subunit
LSALQSISGTQLTETQTAQQLQDAYQAAQTSYQTAVTNADVQVRSSQTTVDIQKASLDAAQAALDLKKSGPREVDLAPLRASVSQAQVAYDQAVSNLQNIEVIAPVDGIVSDVIPSLGEQVPINSTVVSMVGTQSYDIEANVPEADITKIQNGQTAQITLDAYGDEVKFTGSVTAKDPAETRIQDAIYYKIHVQIDPAGHEVKPGMTANVTITTGSAKNVLIMPLRAIRTDASGKKSARVLIGGQPQDRNVSIGLKGDEGRVEVTSGVSEGENVIVGS